ncbi:T9SS type A sorting domain-containing protein [Flavobacterium humi]|uniref:T9SS type A sorting domain-containing protein n=1 Tax=Flavobacterium humi TaxID=2562683 RepID=A0A4Z0L708_9FLAO|nr:zinc-dependent metalloprotease family protein [Flavobacterium humi]TGD57787.1 T9SS type A sorting domain-containing protein [Flavobacterium humi]
MKKQLLFTFASVFMACQMQAQTDKQWAQHKGTGVTVSKTAMRPSFPKEFKLFDLNIDPLRQTLFSINSDAAGKRQAIISLPNADGQMEQFEVYEASNFEADLQAQFPEIRAYSGKGITDKYATLKLSVSPQGIQTMVFRTDKENEFIEPYSQDSKVYAVFKSQRNKGKLGWKCATEDEQSLLNAGSQFSANRSSTGQLKTMRLAQSCTAEYSNYFGAASAANVALVLAAFNATLTRCNGVYEKDLGLHLNLVASSTNVIYYDATTDPYSDAAAGAGGAWNTELQNTLSGNLTGVGTPLAANNAAYDIGHLFGASGGGGNAGCIGCVCSDDTASATDKRKGSGFTSPGDDVPAGDSFDIDYVVHEVGHQLGANHTFSMSNEGSGVNMEVGSGVTIMGYAGITNYDVTTHSIDVYHAASIAQIQANLATKSCPVTVSIAANNATPVANAGADVTIPKSTPFILTGSATDANAGDALTYSWEQFDNDAAAQTNAASAASETKATGPNWRSYSPTASPSRVFPIMATVLGNSKTTAGAEINVEALSSVARTLTFRLTVRDNAPFVLAPAKVGQTNFDDMIVTVDATRGPLSVTSQNVDNQSWARGSSQTIVWTVNNTNTSTGGANVDILLSTDGGLTFPTVLVAGTPNDGSQSITVPNISAMNCRVMVKASAGIFFNVNPKPIAIGYTVSSTCNTYTNNTALPVPDGAGANTPGAIVTKTVTVPGPAATISDVNVTLGFTHSYIEDLVIAMEHPDGTQVTLWNRNCDNAPTTLTYTFSDGNPLVPTTGCSATSGTFGPASALSVLNGKPSNGVWTLLAGDFYNGDTGTINAWSVEVCSQTYTLGNEEFEFENFSLYPNPNNGDFTIKFTSASSNDIKVNVHDIRGRQVYEKSFSNTGAFNQNITLDKVQAGVYLVSIVDGAKKTVKRIVVE